VVALNVQVLVAVWPVDHFPDQMEFPDFSTRAGKDSSLYCL